MRSLSLTVKGQVTVPVRIRSRLGLKPGDRVHFREEKGRVFIERDNEDISSLFGMFKTKKTASLADIDRAFAVGWAKRARR